MKVLHVLAISWLIFVSAYACVAQEKELSKDEFYSMFRAGLDKGRGINRRNVQKIQEFADGKLTATEEWQYEYDGTDNIHYVHIMSNDGITSRTEEIDIGKTTYCKHNSEPWVLSRAGCIGGSAGAGPADATIKYTIQTVKLDNKDVSLLQKRAIYKDTYSKTKDSDGLSFDEWKLWLNKDGFFLREELTTGLVDPKTIKRHTVDTYEYDPKIKVEAPIIGSRGDGFGGGSSDIGGPITRSDDLLPDSLPKILSTPKVAYTEMACAAHFQGSVVLRVTFLASGEIGQIAVIKAAPYGLTEQAISAAHKIKFEPAKINGQPTTVTKQIVFTLAGC